MKIRSLHALLLALAAVLVGCSQQTQQEASEALDATGEAVESAAEDAVNVTEGAVEGAGEAVDENQAEPDTN